MRSLWAGVSGLQAHQIAMDVEGNNIANVNTSGFKYSRANFSDMLSQTAKIATAPQGNIGGKNPMQVGLGTEVNSVTRIFSQGSVQTTGKATDLAIQGDGFFVVSQDGGTTYKYSRNGDFVFDSDGNFVTNNGLVAQGWVRDPETGKIDTSAPIQNIQIQPGLTTPAKQTSEVSIKANLNAGNLIENMSPIRPLDSTDGLAGQDPNSPKDDEKEDDFGVLFTADGQSFNIKSVENNGGVLTGGQGIEVSFDGGTNKKEFRYTDNPDNVDPNADPYYFRTTEDLRKGLQDYANSNGRSGVKITVNSQGKFQISNKEGSTDLTVDKIEFSAVIDKGQHYEITRFKIKNTGDQNFTNLVVEVPDELKKYLSVDLEKTSLDPMETTYMTVSLNGIESSMEIKTDLKLKTGSDFIMNIPADIKITVMGYQDPTSCEGKSDGEYCLGGICCSGVCRIKAECCNDLDCGNGKCSNYRCISQTDINCLEGTCYPGENESACPENTIYTYYKCTINGEPGVCCKASADNECADKSDGSPCSKGICCSGVCVEGDCCSDSDCSAGEVCSDHTCQSSSGCSSGEVCAVSCEEGWVSTGKTCITNNGDVGVCCMWSGTTGDGDYTFIIIIVVLVIIGLVGWFAYTKFFKGKKPTEEELEEEFSDEDFY